MNLFLMSSTHLLNRKAGFCVYLDFLNIIVPSGVASWCVKLARRSSCARFLSVVHARYDFDRDRQS